MGTKIKEIVEELLKPFEEEGFEIWNVEYCREGNEKQLCVFVDKEGGIGINDCETISRFLSDRLDEKNPIKEPYSLIVSSPGIERRLIKDAHFKRYEGRIVQIALYKSYNGYKKFVAKLLGKTEDGLHVTPINRLTMEEDEELFVPVELVSKVNLILINGQERKDR